jgi:hypothetical protein
VILPGGGKYGMNYDAIYGSLRLFRFIEIRGGWAINGKEGCDEVNWRHYLNRRVIQMIQGIAGI